MLAGTVVSHRYKSLDGNYVSGLFLIIYDEKYDLGILPNGNLLGLKITSTCRQLHYDVPLKKKFNPYLDHDSYVMCSKPHVLDKRDMTILGKVTSIDLLNVYKSYKRFNYQIDDQVSTSIHVRGMEDMKEKVTISKE